jgi:cytochrome c556
MSRKSWIAFGAATIVAIGIGVVQSTHSIADSPVIAQRRALMKEMGKQMGIINDFLEKGTGTAADATAAVNLIQTDSAKIPDLFPQGTSLDDNVGETGAKPGIWANFADFKQHAEHLGELATATAATIPVGEKTAISDAFANMGKDGCGACHQTYRQKLN